MLNFETINEKFPIRRTDDQKANFFKHLKDNLKNYDVKAEKSAGKHNNIVIGDVNNAEVIFTAHYDTPASSLFPNLMLPRSPILAFAYHFSIPLLMAFISIIFTFALNHFLKLPTIALIVLVEVIYISFFYFGMRFFTNKNNANDNTSGVCTVLNLCLNCNNPKVAFILFDNEERGLLGSKTFKKENALLVKDKLLINLDCVGVGDHFLLICKPDAQKHKLFEHLSACASLDNTNKTFNLFPNKGSVANSDHKPFDCAIAIVACKKNRLGIFYTSKIHTNKDNNIDLDNLKILTQTLLKFTDKI